MVPGPISKKIVAAKLETVTDHRTEIDDVLMAIRDWLAHHPEKVDDRL